MKQERLGNLAEIRSGYAFRKSPTRAEGGGCRLVQVRDLDTNRGWVNWPLEEIEAPPNLEEHRLEMTDILLAARGNRNSAAQFGCDPSISNDDDSAGPEVPAVASSQVLVLRPREVGQRLLPAYLVWYLNRAETQEKLARMRAGSSIPFLPVEALKTLEVPLPSYELQHHITHLHELAQQEAALMTQIQEKRRELMAGVMQCLLSNERAKS